MKKLLAIFLSTIYFCACSSMPPFYINQAMKAKDRDFNDKLPNLEAIYENEGELKNFSVKDSFIQVNTPEANKFYREVEKNLVDITTDKKGYIVLKPIVNGNKFEVVKDNFIVDILCVFTLGLFCAITDMPKNELKSFYELEARILNNDGKLIKKYSTEQTASMISSPQKNFCLDVVNDSKCYDQVKWDAYENALADILEQIHNDRAFLIKELNK